MTDTALIIEAPTRFAVAFLERNKPIIERYLEEIAFMPIELMVQPPAGAPAPQVAAAQPVATPAAAIPAAAVPAVAAQPIAPEHRRTAGRGRGALDAARELRRRQAHRPPPPRARVGAAAGVGPFPASIPGAGAGGTVPLAREKDPSGVNVTNTMSRDDFMRILNANKTAAAGGQQVEVQPAAAMPAAPSAVATAAPEPPAPVSSKFTFDTFVYGDENKHAYHSAHALRRHLPTSPASATPCSSTDDSGLGKTHLLLAIKNHLAAR